MVKIVKRRRKPRWDNLIVAFFMLSCLLYLSCMTIVKAENVVLAKKENQIERINDILSNDVANLELEVKQLDNRERVLAIVQEHGLEVNQENIVSVADSSD